MLNTPTLTMETMWNTFQEPRCPAVLPGSYMLLLSALDQGWRVDGVESVPSWDQHGFIYLVTLAAEGDGRTQELVLPQNGLVTEMLREKMGEVKDPQHYGHKSRRRARDTEHDGERKNKERFSTLRHKSR